MGFFWTYHYTKQVGVSTAVLSENCGLLNHGYQAMNF